MGGTGHFIVLGILSFLGYSASLIAIIVMIYGQARKRRIFIVIFVAILCLIIFVLSLNEVYRSGAPKQIPLLNI
jgi:uncharacterized membrane protein